MIELVDVYYPGEGKPRPPFLLVGAGATLLPPATPGNRWTFWKRVPINIIAVNVDQARRLITEQGYYLQ
jgi:hypothetical protein